MVVWPSQVVWWQVYALGFLGAEPRALPPGEPVRHRLPALLPWLDYAAELGVTGLMLGPVSASGSHGYDTVDLTRVDPRLGDEADLRAVIDAAHARGIRVILDGVFNHVGQGFGPFRQALAEGAGSRYDGWFGIHRDWDGRVVGWECFEGHRMLPRLNHANPEVAEAIVGAMRYWLDLGADGWRLDAAHAVPSWFWRWALPQVRATHPDAWFSGEVVNADHADYARETGIDSLSQYDLNHWIPEALNTHAMGDLAGALERHNRYLDAQLPMTFLGNHDTTRIASRLTDSRHLGHALAVLLTVGGSPCLYSGDEQGYLGRKENGDPSLRPAFPASPEGFLPIGWATHDLHRSLIALRRRHDWLGRARTRVHASTSTALLYEVHDGWRRLLVALNCGDGEVPLDLDPAHRVEAGGVRHDPNVAGGRPRLPEHGWAVLAPAA